MNSTTTAPPRPNRRGRAKLIALFAVFFGSMLLAAILRFSGWQPTVNRNHGELLSPAADLRAVTPRLADGSAYEWRPAERTWRIALAPPAHCAPSCMALAADLDKVWQLMGHNASHVDVLWIGTPPAGLPAMPALRVVQADPALLAGLPRVDDAHGTPVYVIDPNGFVVLRYAPGFDAGGLRADLAKLLKLM
ncbi:MAG TPA: hypothetical protein VGC74_03735 [Stenotrophomonas sp.]|jgi:hypothetical protein